MFKANNFIFLTQSRDVLRYTQFVTALYILIKFKYADMYAVCANLAQTVLYSRSTLENTFFRCFAATLLSITNNRPIVFCVSYISLSCTCTSIIFLLQVTLFMQTVLFILKQVIKKDNICKCIAILILHKSKCCYQGTVDNNFRRYIIGQYGLAL